LRAEAQREDAESLLCGLCAYSAPLRAIWTGNNPGLTAPPACIMTLQVVVVAARPDTDQGRMVDMDVPYRKPLRLGEDASLTIVHGPPPNGRGLSGPHNPREFAERLFANEALQSAPPLPGDSAEPYSLQWFLNIEDQRHSRHGRWIPRLLEF